MRGTLGNVQQGIPPRHKKGGFRPRNKLGWSFCWKCGALLRSRRDDPRKVDLICYCWDCLTKREKDTARWKWGREG